MIKSARGNGWLKWLLTLNLIGLTLLGGRYWYHVQGIRREERKQTEVAVNAEVRATGAPRENLEKLFALSDQFLRKQGISDADLDWCLSQLKPNDRPGSQGALYRNVVCQILVEAVPQMNAEQKERTFQAASEMLAHADRNEEIGMDVTGSMGVMRFLEDKRAIPMLRPLLTDKRARVRQKVAQTITQLEAKPVQ